MTMMMGRDDLWPDEQFDRAVRDMFRDFFANGALVDRLSHMRNNPIQVEEYVESGTDVIRAELPGMDPEKDIDIRVSNGLLTISAQREERSEQNRPGDYRSEFRYGSFHRAIRLPEGASEKDVHASYKDGILEVRTPIANAPATPAKIAVKRG